MTVTELFAREHALFRAFLDSLERELAASGERARANVAKALRLLLPALDGHAEIEGIVFRHPPDEPDGDRRALGEVAAQHGALATLRDEILSALEQATGELPFTRLQALTAHLVGELRQHLDTEERRLWPLYQRALMRPLDAVIPLHLERRARALEQELGRGIAAINPVASPQA
jgi:hemerythrin-like domain-containing protein